MDGSRFESWLFDAYPSDTGITLWLLDDEGRPHRLHYRYHPAMYIAGERPAVASAAQVLQRSAIRFSQTPTVQREFMSGAEVPVIRLAVHNPLAFSSVMRLLTKVPGLTLYNCDIAVAHLFFYDTRLFPLARCVVEHAHGEIKAIEAVTRPEECEYTLPPLVTLRLRLETGDPLAPTPAHRRGGLLEASIDGETVVLCGDEPVDLVTSINRLLKRYDPDVILTACGDAVLLPQLRTLAARTGVPLLLNRDPRAGIRMRRARSYMTYGQVVYQAAAQMLHGRWHIDLRNSFIFGESEMAGLLEIARLARLPVQYLARTSTGTAISSMQLAQAVHDGILIPWQKSEPEAFKTASQLIVSDKGGLTYQPLVGVFEGVGELDFSSMYPTIMSKFNVSPETVSCVCCPDSRVPEIGYTICTRRRGLVPRVLDHLLERRAHYKRRKRETTGSTRELYNQRQTALKWCLVTCLDGETFVPFKKDGQTHVSSIKEVIDAFLPEGPGILPVRGLSVFGFDKLLRPIENPVKNLIKAPAPRRLLQVRLQMGRKLRMIPAHRCFVLRKNSLVMKHAADLRVGDLIPVAPHLPLPPKGRRLHHSRSHGSLQFMTIRSVEVVPPTSPYVYCFEVEKHLHGFVASGGIFTGNSFGFLGYRNARFGRIEANEAVTAYSREMLLQAKEIAERRGFQMLHALVDSMWLQKPGATREDYETLARTVTDATGLPIFVEGVYRWIGFLPSKTHRGVGVPNRYMGVFDDNTTKVRGIEVRRSDVPILIEQMQERMLQRMFQCATPAEVHAIIPELLAMLEETLVRLRAGDVTAPELVVTNTLSQEAREYVHNTMQAINARTLERHGVPVHPGEAVQFIITDRKAKIPEDRVRPYALLGTDWSYDVEAYAEMLLRAAETVLELFGHSRDRLRREIWDRVRANLTSAKFRERSGPIGPGNGY